MSRPYTEARARNNRIYDAKTYKKVSIALRLKDDAEIIKDFEESKARGVTSRQWINYLWKNRNK